MKWVTRENANVDRIACPWLVARFVDGSAEFHYVPSKEVLEAAKERDAVPYDIPRGCACTYFPEANALVPVRQVAHTSNTPASKSVVITVSPALDSAVDPERTPRAQGS